MAHRSCSALSRETERRWCSWPACRRVDEVCRGHRQLAVCPDSAAAKLTTWDSVGFDLRIGLSFTARGSCDVVALACSGPDPVDLIEDRPLGTERSLRARTALPQFRYSVHVKYWRQQRSSVPNYCSNRLVFECTPERPDALEMSATLRRLKNRSVEGRPPGASATKSWSSRIQAFAPFGLRFARY
jgi:hypothetical protein